MNDCIEYIVRDEEICFDGTRHKFIVGKLIRCRDCKHHHYDGHGIPYCDRNNYGYGWTDDDFCSYPEKKDEYVTLRHEDINFIDEDAENAFYESLVEEILEDDWDD